MALFWRVTNIDIQSIVEAARVSHVALFEELSVHYNDIELIAKKCQHTLEAGGKLFFIGNGGSAADSQHLAAEFVVRFKRERSPLAAIALTTDTSILTAHSNDYSFDTVFSRQLEALGSDKDMVFGLTTSGNSPNIINALNVAKEKGIFSVALTGRDGGAIKGIADQSIVIQHEETARIQEAHLFIGHCLCDIVDRVFATSE